MKPEITTCEEIIFFILYFAGFIVHSLYEAKRSSKLTESVLKIIPTTIIAVFAWLHCPAGTASLLICFALTVCIAADFMLNYINYIGAGLFVICHILLIAGFSLSGRVSFTAIAVFIICIACFGALYAYCRKKLPNSWTLAVYGLLLSFMVSLSTCHGNITLIGAAMFAISDGMIGYRMVNKAVPGWYAAAVMLLYYSGLYVIALTL